MKNLWIVFGGLMLLGGISLYLLRRETTTAGSVRSSAPDGDIRAEVASLRREVASLRTAPGQTQPTIVLSAAEKAEPSAAALPPATELTFEQKVARFEQESEALAFALDQRIATEGRDPVWSNDSQRGIDVTLKERVPGATVVESSCSANVCRATVQQASAEDQKDLSSAIASASPFDQGTFYRYDRSANPPKTILYVVRAGHNLAELTGLSITGTSNN